LFEQEDRRQIPDDISTEQVSFVYLYASFLGFCPGQQKDAHLRVNVAVDARRACDRPESDLEDHKKTRKDIHIKAWKNLRMGLSSASLRKKEATRQHHASARTVARLIRKLEIHSERFCLSRQKVVA
jgi:hypothetical protein